MKTYRFSLLLFALIISPIFAQEGKYKTDFTGSWYESTLSGQTFEINIQKEEKGYRARFNTQSSQGINVVNAPFTHVSFINDTLLLKRKTNRSRTLSYKFYYDAKKQTLSGHTYFNKVKYSALNFTRKKRTKPAANTINNQPTFTRQDTLRGSITAERVWWDVSYYHLNIKVDPDKKYIAGTNKISYKVLKPHNIMQIDLQTPLKLIKAVQNGEELKIKHEGNAHFIHLKKPQEVGDINTIEVHYKGFPHEAMRAPWDGGFSWKKDHNGKHFVATSCQGIGASIWWPNKDHMYDEPDSMLISVTNPDHLTNVSNGRLRGINKNNDGTVTSHWFVSNPINNYGVNVNIGDYAHFSEIFPGEKGPLTMDYWVLKDNVAKAKIHFKDAPKMMQAFEHWFGPYPFYEDGFKLVETPYLGMEHQSSVTYGNKYKKGYLGNDISGSGWGLKFDFLIIHESGHEWFANNITYKDIADMWIHEGFTNYSENLFLDYHYGKQAASEYVTGSRKNIQNDRPIIGHYNVNHEGSHDMYAKGGNLLHTLRQVINDDALWRAILRGLNKTFYHKTVTTEQVENYIAQKANRDLKPFFNQYLRTAKIPTFEYYFSGETLIYRWLNAVPGFNMPLKVFIEGKAVWLTPKTNWTHHYLNKSLKQLQVDPNFYVGVMQQPAVKK